jgi:tetratricopeptide (TPR) repeat protein
LREAARLEPAWDRPAFELGQIYFARRECESALPWLSRVPPNRPGGLEAGFKTGICHLLGNDLARAEAAFAALAQRLPNLPELHNNLGVARLRQGRWNEAAAEFEHARALDSESPDYWLNLGLARMAVKQPSAAVAPLRQALALHPADNDARSLLISALESLGRASEAAAVAGDAPSGNRDRLSTAVPQEPFALARLARVAMEIDLAAARPEAISPASETAPQRTPRASDRP